MPFDHRFFDIGKRAIDYRFLELFQSFCVVALAFGLGCQTFADEILLLWSDVFSQGGSDEPVLDVTTHIESIQGL